MSNHSIWTIGKLKELIKDLPDDARIFVTDADTCWTIPIMTFEYEADNKELWLYPCEYSDMQSDIRKRYES